MGIYSKHRTQNVPSTGDEPVPRQRPPQAAADLDIEKKWLQLARVDQEQFAYFFDKYHDRIFQYVYMRLGDHDLAGELTGEVFTRAWKRIGRFSWQGYSFGAWLFQIARWVIGHELRRQKKSRETEFIPEQHGGVVQGDPESAYVAERDREMVRMCVARLPAEQQDVFVLHYWMGMTMAQVALVMKIPAGTVASHLSRGRKTLLGWLQELGLEGGVSPGAGKIVEAQAREDSGLKVVDRDTDTGNES